MKVKTNVITVNNLHKMSNKQIHNLKKSLLKPLVKDEQILDIMATDENFKKIAHRVSYIVKIEDEQGQPLLTGERPTGTPEQVQQNIKDLGIDTGMEMTYEHIKKMKNQGYAWSTEPKKGKIKAIKYTITIR